MQIIWIFKTRKFHQHLQQPNEELAETGTMFDGTHRLPCPKYRDTKSCCHSNGKRKIINPRKHSRPKSGRYKCMKASKRAASMIESFRLEESCLDF